MKAVVFRKDRGLVYEEVPDYTVAEDEVLVKTANTGFCGSDHSLVAGGHLADGYILGHEISAVIVEKGAAADGPPVGTRVCTVSYTHLRAHETVLDLVCRLLLEKKKNHKSYICQPLHNALYGPHRNTQHYIPTNSIHTNMTHTTSQ